MESFFQAAACALDKVLDDFEQTEDDVDYFGLVPAARGSEMFSSQDGIRRAGLSAPEPLPPPTLPPPVGTDTLSEKRFSLPALISPPLAPLVDGHGGERDRPFLSLPSNFIAEKPGSPPSQSFSSASSSASSVESPLPSPSFPMHPPAPENLPSTSPPSQVASPWASLLTDDARGTAPIDPFATTRCSNLAVALDVGLVSPAVTSSDETLTPSPPRSSQQPQFTRDFEAAQLQDCLVACGGGEEVESVAHNACRPPLVTFDLLSAGPGAETLAPQHGPPLCDLLSGTHDNKQRPRDDEQRPRDAITADTSPASGVDRTLFRGDRAEGRETNGDGSSSTSEGGERLTMVCGLDEPLSPDRDLSDETLRNSGSAAEMSSENDASAMFEAESVRADACRDDSPQPPLSAEALAATGVEMFAEGGEFNNADRSCGEGEISDGGVAIDRPTALDDCRRGVDSEASEPPSEPSAEDSLRHWLPIPGDGADVVPPPLLRGAEREALPKLVNKEEVAMPTLSTEEPKKAQEELQELEELEEPGASITVKEEGTAPQTNGAADVSESDAELEAFLSSLEASADSPPASPAPSLKEDRVTEEKEVEDSKSDTSGDSVSPLRGGGVDSGSPAMAPLLFRHAAPAHNGNDTPGAARPPPGGARPKQPLRLQLPRPASNLLGSHDEADGREPPEAHAAPSSATENHVGAMAAAPAEGGEDDEDDETTQEEEEEERGWSHGPDGASRARAGGESPAGGTQGREGPGMSAPMWVPDAEAPNCMRCKARFTFTRRRHHCRACGKVFCAPCCSQKSRLRYMENKEARVCIHCHIHIDKAAETVDRMVALAPSPLPAPPSPISTSAPPPSGSPNPNNPAEYCSTLPPLQQARAAGTLASPPPTVMVPVSALKHPGQDGSQREPRRVWFADGILPNGEVADATILSGTPGTPVPGSSPPPTPPPAAAAARDPGLPISLSEPEPLPPTVAPVVPVTAVVPMVPAALAASLGPLAAPGAGPRVLPAPTGSPVGKGLNLIPDDDEGLPPILISSGVKGDYSVEERPSPGLLVAVLEEAETQGGGADAAPVVFVLNANLLVSLRIINYVNRRCWVFATRGMHAVGQAEVVVLLQCLPDEKTVPKDVFHSLLHVYTDAYKGKPVGHLGHSFLGRGFLGSREHGGFLFVSPAMQALPACELPPQPLLFALLIQKWEAPWAKVFPIRLMLRLGAEFRFYPCPLFSVRFRKPLFGETGHTIMNLLADFRNYQYSLPTVPGLVVSMEMGHTWIDIPSNRYNQMVKVLNGANEHVLAFGAVFNSAADSHLVCVQNDDGNYQTQAINIHATPRKVTGASFVVFNGALKSSSGFLAKSSIVEGPPIEVPSPPAEPPIKALPAPAAQAMCPLAMVCCISDGLMVQITAEGMEALRSALREMRDHTLVCGRADGEPPREHVHARWVADDAAFNRGVTSPIDGRSMEGVPSVKIFQGSEFKGSGKIIRWTEVFFLQKEEEGVGEGGSREGGTSTFDPADHSRVAEAVARAFCVALAPRLKELREDGLTQLGLRLTLHSEQVGYQAGGNGQPLPVQYMNELDCALIPIMHGGGGGGGPGDGAVRMELVFSIMENVS